jgi:putrescine transport system substrate-binding protein
MKMRSLVSAVALLAISTSVSMAGEVRLFSWEAYFGADSIKKFEAESGNTVTYDVFDSNDMVETRVLAGNSGYDVVTPNLSPHLARQIPLKAWGELDKSKLPNISNLDPELTKTRSKPSCQTRQSTHGKWCLILLWLLSLKTVAFQFWMMLSRFWAVRLFTLGLIRIRMILQFWKKLWS